MKDLFFKKMSVALKILCVIAIIATAGSVQASAAKKTNKRKAKTTKVKKTRKRHQVVQKDYRVVAAMDEVSGTGDIILGSRGTEDFVSEEFDGDEVLKSAAHMPSFPGGDAGLMEFLMKNVRYPQAAADNYIEGRVIVQFVVTKTGKVGEVKVVRSVDPDLDREAMRVCKALPKFSPGRNAKGKPVNVWYTLPITFKLTGSDVEQYMAKVQERAKSGDAQAQYELGQRYYFGMGIEQDSVNAVLWLNEAAKQGHKDAKSLLDIIIKDANE